MSRLLLLCSLLFVWGCSSTEDGPDSRYQAEIRWTEYGVPHILAEDIGSATFAQGYACGKMNLWIMAEQFVRVRSERARYFGPGPYNANIISDLGNKIAGIYDLAREGFKGLDPDLQEVYRGYAAGYNKALAETSLEDCPYSCRNLDWLQPINEIDLFAYSLQLAVAWSTGRLQATMIAAQPPTVGEIAELPPLAGAPKGLGSNAWAFGRKRSQTGNGILLANPHFPWDGELRMFESHLHVPGKVNVSGVSILGVPLVGIGFNESMGWTHTVCTAHHGNFYRLHLVPGQPEAYYYDGEVRRMEAREHEIQVLQPDGSLQTLHRTSWHSHYGPMIAAEGFEWTEDSAYSFRDANAENVFIADFWYRAAKSKSVRDLKKALEDSHGVPWINTLAADRSGETFYGDGSSVPNLSPQALQVLKEQIESHPTLNYMYHRGITILDGSRSLFEWQDGDEHRKGLVPFAQAPQLLGTECVGNSNDSHWLTQPEAPLEGYSLLFGPERSERSLRTRQGIRLFGQGVLDQETIMQRFDDTRSLSADLLLDDLLARCEAAERSDLQKAYSVLRNWDRRFDLQSVGAHLWREFISQFKDGDRHLTDSLFQVPFDPEDPVNTPNRLATSPAQDPFLEALVRSVGNLERAGIALDCPFGELQYCPQGAKRVALPGGSTTEGIFNVAGYRWMGQGINLPAMVQVSEVVNPVSHLTKDGYPVNFGASYCLVAEFTPDGPRAKGRLAYSQSTDPSSPHFSDQAWLESEGQWRDMLFAEEEILADPQLEIERIAA